MENLTHLWEQSGRVKTRPPSWLTYAQVAEGVLDVIVKYFPALSEEVEAIKVIKPYGERNKLKAWSTSIKYLAQEKGLIKTAVGGCRSAKGIYAVQEIVDMYVAYLQIPPKVRRSTLVDEVEAILYLREQGLTSLAIADAIGGGITHDTVRRVLIDESIDTSRVLLCKNPTFFNKIDTHNKAYILGLTWADGNIKSDLTTFSIGLHTQDKYLLEQINIYMSNNTPLNKAKDKEHYTLRIHSKELVNDLLQYGMMPAKTLDIAWPTNVFQEFIPSFIAGLFDGDGTVSYYTTKRPSRPCNTTHGIGFSICCSWNVGNPLKDYLISKGIKVIIYPHPGGDVTLADGRRIKGDPGRVCIVQGGAFRNSLNFAHLIYSNCDLHLLRKKAKFKLALLNYKGREDFTHLYPLFNL